MIFRILISALFSALLFFESAAGISAGDEEPLFEVLFTRDGVAFAGTVDTEENALILAEFVKAIRPDLKILNRGLKIDANAEMPSLSDLKSLLAELGIATHEGRFSLYEDSLIIGGMTDSRITLTALRIRLEPFLTGREFINRLCIVSKDDMPKLSIRLSSGETSGPLLDFDVAPTAAEAFEPPGLSIANLFPMILTLSDLSRLTGKPSMTEVGGSQAPLQAVPLLQVKNIGGRQAPPVLGMLRAIPAEPQPTYVPLPSISYTHSTFLLQANQEPSIESVVKQLSTPPLAGHAVYIRPVKSSSQSSTFGDYLVEKRGEATRELLAGRGISAGLMTIQTVEDQSSADTGEVRLVVEIPPVVPEEEITEETVTAANPTDDATGETRVIIGQPRGPVR